LTRYVHLSRVADRHGFDPPGAIDEHADAPAEHVAGLGQLTGQLVGDDVVRRNPAAIEPLDAVLVGLGEAEQVTVDFGNRALPLFRRGRRLVRRIRLRRQKRGQSPFPHRPHMRPTM
jgi:hypothetical protein